MILPINNDSRKKLVLFVLIFSCLACWGYVSYLEPIWGYFGLQKGDISISTWVLTLLFCVFPTLVIPVEIKRPSMFAVWILYIFTYIPMIIGAFFDKQIAEDKKLIISTSYLVGFLLLCLSYKFKLFKTKPTKLPTKYFWTIYYVITFSMLGYIVFLFRDNLTFANIFSSEDVYDLRFSGQEIENQSAVAGHFIMWLSNALFPFVLSVGLVEKNRKKIIIGIVGLIIMYMTMANKQFLLSIIFTTLIYKLFASGYKHKIALFITCITIPAALLLYGSTQVNIPILNEAIFLVSSIYLLRTIYTSTFMSVYYNAFFENHPYIYFSHITGINQLIDYPYQKAIGIEVGSYFTDFENYNANANFFITDGLSSIGLPGLIIIGLFCSLVFYLFDSFATKNNILLGILLISNSCVALMNVSLFTTLVSGGMIFFMILINNSNLLKIKNV